MGAIFAYSKVIDIRINPLKYQAILFVTKKSAMS